MRRSFTRHLSALALCLGVLLPGPLLSPAHAQETPAVSIHLISQSIWNGPDRPLELRFAITNDTASPLKGLTVVLTIGARAGSRSAYQQSLQQDATPDLFSYPSAQAGSVDPGQSRAFTVRQDLHDLSFLNANGLYPVRVRLLSEDVVVATLRTPMVFLAETPQTPIHLAWSWVLSEPLQFGPDGIFVAGPIEPDIAPGGRIDAMVRAMDAATPAPVDLVMSPVLADELVRMAAGYRIDDTDGSIRTVPASTAGAADAARLLDLLRKIAGRPKTELVALPYGDVHVPALFPVGFGPDLATLLERGREEVGTALGAQPRKDVFRPPQSQIDTGTADRLGGLGVSTLLLSHQTIPLPSGLVPNPSPVVRVTGTGHPEFAVLEDGEMANLVAASRDDPVLAAHVAVGQLAAVWLDSPGTPGRGVAMLFPEGPSSQARFFRSFVSLARGSPWLRPTKATAMLSTIQGFGQEPIPPQAVRGYSPVLVERISQTRRRVALFTATVGKAVNLTPRLETALLLAESGTSIERPGLGVSFLDWADRQINAAYRRVRPPDSGLPVTLTSQHGSIPLDFRNGNAFPVRVAVRLIADRRLAFPKGNVRTITLPPRRLTRIFFDVRAETTGRFPMKLQVLPPDPCSSCTIAETRMIVRSTAYNRVALAMTIGAALFLLGWWARRLIRGRKA